MSDEITGVVILQPMPHMGEGVTGLWFTYTRADGIRGQSWIPVIERGKGKPAGYTGPLWNYALRCPWVDCSPSVRILGPRPDAPDHFHNGGQWSNHCVIMATPYGSEPEARFLVDEINEPKTKEERDTIILSYRAKGVFL